MKLYYSGKPITTKITTSGRSRAVDLVPMYGRLHNAYVNTIYLSIF